MQAIFFCYVDMKDRLIQSNTAPLDYHSIRTPGNYDVNYWSVYRIFVNSGFYQTET